MRRKILDIQTVTTTVNKAFVVKATYVVFALLTGETARTYKASDLFVRCYINRRRSLIGGSRRCYRKPLSIKKNGSVDEATIETMKRDAWNEAIKSYLMTLNDLEGRVVFFDKSRGEGMVAVDSLGTTFSVYACNLKGKKTWYAETACVYLNKGDTVKIDKLAEVSDGLTALVSEGVHFDAEKWASLDQSRLAFKCDENGNAINGLFAEAK
jgi:hypothetical protein